MAVKDIKSTGWVPMVSQTADRLIAYTDVLKSGDKEPVMLEATAYLTQKEQKDPDCEDIKNIKEARCKEDLQRHIDMLIEAGAIIW